MREFRFELQDDIGGMQVRVTDQRHEGLVVVELIKDGQPAQILMSPADVEALVAILEAETKEAGHA